MQRYDLPSGSAANGTGLFAFFPGFHSVNYGPEAAGLPPLHHPTQQPPLTPTVPGTELPAQLPYHGPYPSFHRPGSLGFHPAYSFGTAAVLPTAAPSPADNTPAAGAGTATTAFASLALAAAHLREPMSDALSLAYNPASFFQHVANEAALSHASHHPLDYAYHLGLSRSILNFNHGFGPPTPVSTISTPGPSFDPFLGPVASFSPTEKLVPARQGLQSHVAASSAKKERRERDRKPVLDASQKVGKTGRSASADSSWVTRVRPEAMTVSEAEAPLNLATDAEALSPTALVKTEAVSPQPKTEKESISPRGTSSGDSVFNTSAVVMILPHRHERVADASEDNPLLDLSQRPNQPLVQIPVKDFKTVPVKGEKLGQPESLQSSEDKSEEEREDDVADDGSCSRTCGRLSERATQWQVQRRNQHHRTVIKQEAAETQCTNGHGPEQGALQLDCCRSSIADLLVSVKKEPLLSPGALPAYVNAEANATPMPTSPLLGGAVAEQAVCTDLVGENLDQQTKPIVDENANVPETPVNMGSHPGTLVVEQSNLMSTKLPTNALPATKRTTSTANGTSIPVGIAIARQRTEKTTIGSPGVGGGASQGAKPRPLGRPGPLPERNPALPSLFLQVPGGVVGKPLSNLGGNSWVVSGSETPFINSTPSSMWINPTQYNGANGEVNPPPVVVPSLPLGYQLAPNPSPENMATSPLLLIPAACIDPFQRVIWPSYSTPQSWPFINSLQSSTIVSQSGTSTSVAAESFGERPSLPKTATVTPISAAHFPSFEEMRIVADAGNQTETPEPPESSSTQDSKEAESNASAAEDLDFSGLKLLSESVERLLPHSACDQGVIPQDTRSAPSNLPETVKPPVACVSGVNTLNVLCALAEQRIREENMAPEASSPNSEVLSPPAEVKPQTEDNHPDTENADVNCNFHVAKSEKQVKAFVESLGTATSIASPSKPATQLMEPHELDMRIKLAELQRRYREKQKELSRLSRRDRDSHHSDSSLSCRSHGKRPAKMKKSQSLSLDTERSTTPPFSTTHTLLPLAKAAKIGLGLHFPPNSEQSSISDSNDDFRKFKTSYTAVLVSASANAASATQPQHVASSPAKKRKPDLPKKHAASSPECTETIVHKKPKHLYRIFAHGSTDKVRVKPKLKAEAKRKKLCSTSSSSSLSSLATGDGIEHHFAVLNLTDSQPALAVVPDVVPAKCGVTKSKSGTKRKVAKAPAPEQKIQEVPLVTTSQTVSCAIVPEELRDGLRVLVRLDDTLFHGGHVTGIRPPDIYGIVVDGERASRPRIYSREEILQEAILEVRPSFATQLPPGTRVCAYWSQQSKCLYPGVIAPPTPANEPIMPSTGHRAVEEEFEVEFDDGDSGRISISEIRLLPPDHPVIQYDPNPLLTLERRRRRPSGYVDTKVEKRESAKQDSGASKVTQSKEEPTVVEEPASKKCETEETTIAVTEQTMPAEKPDVKQDKVVVKLDLHKAESCKSKRKHKKKHRHHHRRHKKKHRVKEEDVEETWTVEPSSSPLPSPPSVPAGEEEENEVEEAANNEDESEEMTDEVSEPDMKKRKKKEKNETKSKMAAFLPKRQLWRWLGTSFKKASKGKGRKEFYKAIHRGKEVIRVGDCAVFLSSGRPDRPYVGRIELLWQSWGGSMSVRVRWFYHPEETCGGRRLATIKMPGALFESPHVDENDVQTISHRCQVVPLPEFERLTATAEQRDPTDGNSDLYYLAGFYDPTSGHLTVEPGVLGL